MIELTKKELAEYIKQGKHFKIKVTPETSKIVQEVVFACGKSWASGDIEILYTTIPYLYYSGELYRGTSDNYFSSLKRLEISLTLSPKLDTQEDRWRFLLDGGKLICPNALRQGYYYMKNHEIVCSSGATNFMLFKDNEWVEYKEPKQWYDYLPEQKFLCWVDDYNKDVRNYVELVGGYESSNEEPYITMTNSWRYATPVTPEEAEKLIYKGK